MSIIIKHETVRYIICYKQHWAKSNENVTKQSLKNVYI